MKKAYTPEQCRHLVRLVLNTRQYVAGENVPLSVFKRPEFIEMFSPERTPKSLHAKFNKSLAIKKISELKKEYKICLRDGIYELEPAGDGEPNLNEEKKKEKKTTPQHGYRGFVIKDF